MILRMLLVLSLYNLRDEADEGFVDDVIRELEGGGREEEILAFPKSFVCLVNYLTLLERFQFDFIDRILSRTFVRNTYGNGDGSY